MSNPIRTLTILLVCSLVIVTCLLAMYRHESDSAKIAKQDLAELKIRLEGIDGELAAIKEQFNQLHDGNAAAQLITVPTPPADQSEVIRQMAQLDAPHSNVLSSVQNLGDAIRPSISLEKVLLGQQQAIAEIRTQSAAQEEKVAAVKSKLNTWSRSLNISDEVAALDASTALKTSELANYWPYFEAKKELEEMLGFTRTLKRKLQIEELDMAIEKARSSGITK